MRFHCGRAVLARGPARAGCLAVGLIERMGFAPAGGPISVRASTESVWGLSGLMYSCSSCIRLPILTCRSEKIPVHLWAARATGLSCFVVHGFTHSPLLPNSFVFLSLVVYQADQATRTLNIHPMGCLELHACIIYIVYGDVDNSHSLPSNQLLGHVVTSSSTKDEKWKTLIVWKLGNKWFHG
jgi:hypothetical protein